MENMLSTWKEVFDDRADQERQLRWKHPGFDFCYNWIVSAAMLAVIIGLIVWGIQIGLEKRDAAAMESGRQEAYAAQAASAEAKAEEERQKQQTREAVIKRWAVSGAKALYPMTNFVELYHYTEADLKTYLRSGTNRADATGKSIEEVFSEPNQYLNYSDSNPVLGDFLEISTEFFTEYYEEKFGDRAKPVDSSYQFAELTPNGIFLVNQFNADGYARRWHA